MLARGGAVPLAFGPFLLDHARASLTRAGTPVEAQPRVLAALELLARSGGRILPREELLDALWPGVVVSDDALHQLLRKVRRALDDRPDAPTYLEAVPRRGWRFRVAVHAVEEDPGLVGRAREVGALLARLGGGEAVVLHGPAGVGKTRLARAVVPGACAVSLRNARSGPEAVDAIAAALALPVESRADAAAVGRALANRPGAALLLDDAEGVAEALPALVAAWAASGARVVVASRSRIAGCATLALGPLPEADGAALFAQRFAEAFPRAAAPPPALVAALVREVEGLPLAIELAVARLRVIPLPELLDRLARSRGVLEDGPDGARRSIQASIALLSAPEQRLLALVSVFPGPFSAADVEGLGVVPAAEVVRSLGRLLDASLVEGEPGAFRLLAAVREVAARRRHPDDPRAWAQWVAAEVVRAMDGLWGWDTATLAQLSRRIPELALAVRIADDAPALLEPLAIGLAAAARYTGPWAVARAALERVPSPGPACLALLAEYRVRTGDTPGAAEALARVAAATSASAVHRAFATFLSARLASAEGAPARGRALALEAAAGAAGHPAVHALALEQAGLAALALGEADAARGHLAAAAALCATPGLALLHGIVSQNHAAALGTAGDHAAALAELRSAARTLAPLPFPHLLAAARANAGIALASLARTTEATAELRAALDLARTIGDARLERQVGGLLGLCALADGRADEAEDWLGRGVALAADASPADRTAAWRRLALHAWDQGRLGVAAELLGRAAGEADPAAALARALADRLASSDRAVLPPPGLPPVEERLVARLLARPPPVSGHPTDR